MLGTFLEPGRTWIVEGSTNLTDWSPVWADMATDPWVEFEDFHADFALGDSALPIVTVDADGVALAAIQGLHQLVTAQQTALHAHESEVHTLDERLEKLERLVTALAERAAPAEKGEKPTRNSQP